ncbi:MAG: GTP 3',8-cyclase MoaA [Pseudomonadota bacterium]|nr:GTP 3',8-cyclase MoaA [Pseudomonadota bacterium]
MFKDSLDKLNRKFEYLRISVTDKCNFRCRYCMPRENFDRNYEFLKRSELLSFEEIIRLTKIFKLIGLKKIKLTGGEPLLRKNIEKLVEGIRLNTNINQISITTNGSLLNRTNILKLKNAGLEGITISLDSISNSTFKNLSDSNVSYKKVLEAIDLVLEIFNFVKVNVVVVKGVNDMDLFNMVNYFKNKKVQLRFIEYMDVGETNDWNKKRVVISEEIIKSVTEKYSLIKIGREGSSTSEKWKFSDYTAEVAFISSISNPFCSSCTRGRLSADGQFFTCLFSNQGYDFREILRTEKNDQKILDYFEGIWEKREDRYSELRHSTKSHKNKINKVEMSYIGG